LGEGERLQRTVDSLPSGAAQPAGILTSSSPSETCHGRSSACGTGARRSVPSASGPPMRGRHPLIRTQAQATGVVPAAIVWKRMYMSVCARERERAWPTKSLPMAEAKRAIASGRILSSAMNLARLNRRAVTPPVLLTCAGRGA
jgi:hypothetical protein